MAEPSTVQSLPYISAQLPGIGGELRAVADHFVVEELPLYEASGEGQHLYVNLTKVGLTTKEVQQRLEQLLNLRHGDVGYAGLKDKWARTTQTFSIPVDPHKSDAIAQVTQRIGEGLPVMLNWARLHKNKLKAGHLLGNRFQITVTNLSVDRAEGLARTQAIAQELRQTGLPNYFGAQRFGKNGANVAKGQGLVEGTNRVRDRWLYKFLISSYQSYLCNRYLARRIELGAFSQLLEGDVAKKYATGGMFDVVDPAVEQPRYAAQEISFTAPLYGGKMWMAKGAASQLEENILAETGLTWAHWQRAHIDGTRRLGRLLLPDLAITPHDEGIQFSFSLPKGAFATTVLREFLKVDWAETPEVDADLE